MDTYTLGIALGIGLLLVFLAIASASAASAFCWRKHRRTEGKGSHPGMLAIHVAKPPAATKERLFFVGASHTFPHGDKLVYGQRGVVAGPASYKSLADKGLGMRFPGNKYVVNCLLTELSHKKPKRGAGILSGGKPSSVPMGKSFKAYKDPFEDDDDRTMPGSLSTESSPYSSTPTSRSGESELWANTPTSTTKSLKSLFADTALLSPGIGDKGCAEVPVEYCDGFDEEEVTATSKSPYKVRVQIERALTATEAEAVIKAVQDEDGPDIPDFMPPPPAAAETAPSSPKRDENRLKWLAYYKSQGEWQKALELCVAAEEEAEVRAAVKAEAAAEAHFEEEEERRLEWLNYHISRGETGKALHFTVNKEEAAEVKEEIAAQRRASTGRLSPKKEEEARLKGSMPRGGRGGRRMSDPNLPDLAV